MAETVLEIPVRAQEQSLWCWAAVTSGISAAYSHAPMAPCQIAAEVLSHGCCADPVPCNRQAALDAALAVVGLHCTIRDVRDPDRRVAFADVAAWIGQGLPIGARIEDTTSGQGHFIAIIGCDPSVEKVVCSDPFGTVGFAAPRYRMKYDDLLTAYGGWGRCTDMFFVG